MILTASMLKAAFEFRATEPWTIFTDSDIIAFRLSTGETGYCSVMGNAGQHHALGLYIGEKGFSTYLKTLSIADADYFQTQEVVMTFDCINCDFMNAADINPKNKKIIKAYAEANAFKIPRPYGWPDFVRFHPYKTQWYITEKRDEQAITEALLAATYMIKLIKEKNHDEIGFEYTETYPTEKGGKTVPYLIPQTDGSYHLSTTKLPALCKDIYPKVFFENDILSHRIKNLQSTGTLQCQFIHIPAPINVKKNMPPVYPALLLCVDSSNGCIIPVPVTEYLDNSKQLLSDFANTLSSSFGHPSKIFVRDDLTKNLLEDFCHKCQIELKKKTSLPELNMAYKGLLRHFMM